MSTIDVANLTDAESTTTNSANANDALNNTTTVDTKFVTNGCAKVYGTIEGDASISSSLNISSATNVSGGKNDLVITNSFSNEYWSGVCAPQSSQLLTSTLSNPASGSMRINSNNSSGIISARSRLIIMGELA